MIGGIALRWFACLSLFIGFLNACRAPGESHVPSKESQTILPSGLPRVEGLTEEEVATLSSLKQVDDYPLYTMDYYGPYSWSISSSQESQRWTIVDNGDPASFQCRSGWACSLFAALGDPKNMVYGRNFDWEDSPAVLLFTHPLDGFASVSMVDIAYLGFSGARGLNLADKPLSERHGLLNAPSLPFDGMNDQGLVVGMAAVPGGEMAPDPDKETIGSLMIIRKVLDHAATVADALVIFETYYIDMSGGPPIHYLIADATGHAILVEFYQGEMKVLSTENPWHLATNFLLSSTQDDPQGECWRYDKIGQRLTETQGGLTAQDATDLLSEVSQDITQWSIVYNLSTGAIQVAMGRQYDDIHAFQLELEPQ